MPARAARPAAPTVARPWTSESTVARDLTLHQIAPYIGRMKTSMAAALVERVSTRGDLVVDPFGGSGVVALEAAARGRRVVSGDWNPYAVLLTRAKLFAPRSHAAAVRRFEATWARSRELLEGQDLRTVPRWVRAFFHPETLRSALALRDACVERDEPLLLACLLGILHHQRPGFLSYPSSHLVPYLRDRQFPRAAWAELYEEREVRGRMLAKLQRTYRRHPTAPIPPRRVLQTDARAFPRLRGIQAVITSPPYMNELDYVRDNRLRLWFIDRDMPAALDAPGENREARYVELMASVCKRLAPGIVPGGAFVLVVGDVTRGGSTSRTGALTKELFAANPGLAGFRLTHEYHDVIPDVRRSRRECRGTKAETILVYRRR